MRKDLTLLKPGEEGVVCSIEGGEVMVSRLDNLGIRPGKKVKKISGQFFRGPISILVDGRRIALGYGISRKVQVRKIDSA